MGGVGGVSSKAKASISVLSIAGPFTAVQIVLDPSDLPAFRPPPLAYDETYVLYHGYHGHACLESMSAPLGPIKQRLFLSTQRQTAGNQKQTWNQMPTLKKKEELDAGREKPSCEHKN